MSAHPGGPGAQSEADLGGSFLHIRKLLLHGRQRSVVLVGSSTSADKKEQDTRTSLDWMQPLPLSAHHPLLLWEMLGGFPVLSLVV